MITVQDLFLRISTLRLSIPPLRERGNDVIGMANKLLAALAAESGRRVTEFTAVAVHAMLAYTWPAECPGDAQCGVPNAKPPNL